VKQVETLGELANKVIERVGSSKGCINYDDEQVSCLNYLQVLVFK